MAEYLKSSDPAFDSDKIVAAFEALPWWVVAIPFDADVKRVDDDRWRTFSGVDAVGAPDQVCDGLSFEEV